jgi:endonuclease/exonuclease/phosphatase family metal-dependent hydrolase
MISKKSGRWCLDVCILVTMLCLTFSNVEAAEQLKILSFNVWSVENTQSGRNTIVDIINTSGADVVGFQELSNATQIAASLGWHLHQNGERPIMSRYPIVAGSPGKQGARIALPSGAYAWVFNVHLQAYPYQPYDLRDGKLAKNEAAVIAAANNTRGSQVTALLNDITAAGVMTSGDKVFLTGDFNEPSCHDWTQAAVDSTSRTYDLKVDWPAARRIIDFGFTDSLRTVRPDEVNDRAYTWTPLPGSNEVHDRIDIIYFAGPDVTPIAVHNIGPVENNPNTDIQYAGYPSDHRAVLATFTLVPPVVNAGNNILTTLALASSPNALILGGSVTDDYTSLLTARWEAFEVALGGGLTTKVVFADATDPRTAVTISEPGTYVLQLTATDNDVSFSDQMEIVVFEDACLANKATGAWVANYYDRNGDCIVDLEDFTIFAAEWLNSTALTESFAVCRR